jgi:enoyl-CoA hydratase
MFMAAAFVSRGGFARSSRGGFSSLGHLRYGIATQFLRAGIPAAREPMKYDEYQYLLFERHPDGILLITINRPDVLNATNGRLHWELSRVWKDVDEDPETNVVIVTGKGRAFSAGGDLDMIDAMKGSHANISQAWKEAGDIVYNMIDCSKPIISAINGVAVGAGLAVAFMADIPIAAENMRITDGHLRLGVAAGDHAVIIWPLLCGMAKAKYYLITADFIDGKEAERIGLVSLCVPNDQLMDKAFEVARKIARGPQQAARFTKRALNNWLKMFGPAFDASLAMEMLGFFSADLAEGVSALKEKRQPAFPHLKKS